MNRHGVFRGLALLAAGVAGAWAGKASGVPAGTIVGALLGSGAYRLAGGHTEAWRGRYGKIGRLLLGSVIGAAIGPDVLAPLRTAILPMCVIIVIIISVGLLLGWALSHVTPLDTATALLSSVPGGLPAMVAAAGETDADATIVAAIHFSRLTTILLLVPALIPLLTSGGSTAAVETVAAPTEGVARWIITLALGFGGGFLALRWGVPTGDLVGAIITVGGVNLLLARTVALPADFREAAMLLIGTSVGAEMSKESLRLLRHAAVPAAALIATLIGVGLTLGWGLTQVTPLDLPTALLSCVPGGASTMAAVAHDLGGDLRLVAALHLIRQIVILMLLPPVLTYLLNRSVISVSEDATP
jgi:membrane AbrB-like protein